MLAICPASQGGEQQGCGLDYLSGKGLLNKAVSDSKVVVFLAGAYLVR